MLKEAPLRVNSLVKPDILQFPGSDGVQRLDSSFLRERIIGIRFLEGTPELQISRPDKSLAVISSKERRTERGSKGFRRGRGRLRRIRRCSKCQGRHSLSEGRCQGRIMV